MGKPLDDIDDYDLYKENGINVYVRVDITSSEDLIRVTYKKTLFRKGFEVTGIDL